MRRILKIFVGVFAIALSSLACGQYVTITPELGTILTPTKVENLAKPALLTSAPTKLGETPNPKTTSWTATVRLPQINVRNKPDGDPTGEYLQAGDTVTVLDYDETGDWVQIEPLPEWEIETAYVWIGCLDLESDRGCESAK